MSKIISNIIMTKMIEFNSTELKELIVKPLNSETARTEQKWCTITYVICKERTF